MFVPARVHEPTPVWGSPVVNPISDPAWRSWVVKGRVQDRRSRILRMKAAKWFSLGGLLIAVGLWSHLPPYEVVVRCIVASGTIIMMFQALHARRYTVAAVSGVLTALFNPVAPVFPLAGDWQRSLGLASAVPFVASLILRTDKLAHID